MAPTRRGQGPPIEQPVFPARTPQGQCQVPVHLLPGPLPMSQPSVGPTDDAGLLASETLVQEVVRPSLGAVGPVALQARLLDLGLLQAPIGHWAQSAVHVACTPHYGVHPAFRSVRIHALRVPSGTRKKNKEKSQVYGICKKTK